MFLETNIATQTGLFALLPQVKDAVSVPVIAAGGIADARCCGRIRTWGVRCAVGNRLPVFSGGQSIAAVTKALSTKLPMMGRS